MTVQPSARRTIDPKQLTSQVSLPLDGSVNAFSLGDDIRVRCADNQAGMG